MTPFIFRSMTGTDGLRRKVRLLRTVIREGAGEIERFRTDLKRLYARGRLKYLDVFESPVRSLRFDVCLTPRQNGTIHCELIGQRNEYEKPQKPN